MLNRKLSKLERKGLRVFLDYNHRIVITKIHLGKEFRLLDVVFDPSIHKTYKSLLNRVIRAVNRHLKTHEGMTVIKTFENLN